MKIFPRLFHKLFCQPLLVIEPVRYQLEAGLLRHMGLAHAEAENKGKPIEAWLQFNRDVKATQEVMRQENVLQTFRAKNGSRLAVVSMHGVIDKNLSQFEMDCYGGYDINDFDNALQAVAANEDIERVVLHIDSPGGSVTGIAESAARVAALTKTKEVHAFVDAMACSAAYYIASQADHIAAAPSAILGSIGVYMALVDATRAAEMEGYKVELITAGKYKAMGSPFKPLSDEERAMLQAEVDSIHTEFKAAVRSGRRAPTERGGHQTVADATMQGQWFNGRQALENRLADSLTNQNLDEYVTGLLRA